MSDATQPSDRRAFLKVAGALAATAATGCRLETRNPETVISNANDKINGFDRTVLDAVAEVVLPSELGEKGRDVAIGQFIAWADAYDPVAEEMHGYGYSDIRYLPPDPAPAWRAQLAALDVLARKSRQKPFPRLAPDVRRELLGIAIKGEGGERLPSPLQAQHIAIALLAHWASSPDAWDLALGAKVVPNTCRALGDANARPLPIMGLRV
jgi:Gluconate 2-dehydrogenase subunit 3